MHLQSVQQIEIEIDQVCQRIEMLRNRATGKARMGRRNDVEQLLRPVKNGRCCPHRPSHAAIQ